MEKKDETNICAAADPDAHPDRVRELTDLPLSLGGLSAFGQFGSAYIPLTVVVNADGTSGFEFDGVLGAEALERVLAVFVRTDGPLAMETVPQEAE